MCRAALLQAVYARCVGPQYAVIVRKMLRAVEALPFTADDLHTASSAHGSFGDVLSQLSHSPDTEARMRARTSPPAHACYTQAPLRSPQRGYLPALWHTVYHALRAGQTCMRASGRAAAGQAICSCICMVCCRHAWWMTLNPIGWYHWLRRTPGECKLTGSG